MAMGATSAKDTQTTSPKLHSMRDLVRLHLSSLLGGEGQLWRYSLSGKRKLLRPGCVRTLPDEVLEEIRARCRHRFSGATSKEVREHARIVLQNSYHAAVGRMYRQARSDAQAKMTKDRLQDMTRQ